jgi:hypothetical protein
MLSLADMKFIEFTTRTYNFKNLAVGLSMRATGSAVNSSYYMIVTVGPSFLKK